MKYRHLGKTDLTVSELTFGCGNTGGLFTYGTPSEQAAVLEEAQTMGVTVFDTSPAYEDSEIALGRAMKVVGGEPVVATKVMLHPEDFDDFAAAVRRSVEGSLERLQVDRLDIVEIHNRLARARDRVTPARFHAVLTLEDVLGEGGVVETLELLREEGKVRAIGFTALGDVETDHEAVASGRFDVLQTYYNLLNPSAGHEMPVMFRHKNFLNLMTRAEEHGVGVMVVRALGAGALATSGSHHRLAPEMPSMASAEWEADHLRARAFGFLEEGDLSLGQAALRFALTHSATSATAVGVSDLEQLRAYVAAVDAGPLSEAQVNRVLDLYHDPYL